MNLTDKGWLSRYLAYRVTNFDDAEIEALSDSIVQLNEPESFIYFTLQPTGIFYGFPIRLPGLHSINDSEWSESEKMKVLLVESLLYIAVYHNAEALKRKHYTAIYITELIPELITFYEHLFDYKPHTGIYNPFTVLENILEKRIEIRTSFSIDAWTSLFHNSLLAIDMYMFNAWFTKTEEVKHENVLKLTDKILRTIACIVASDDMRDSEKKAYFKLFVKSANLPVNVTREIENSIDMPFLASSIGFNEIQSWLLRKLIMEIAILTALTDRLITDQEKFTLDELAKCLKLSEFDLDISYLAIERILVDSQDKIPFLRNKNNGLQIFTDSINKHLGVKLKKNKRMLIQELGESKELVFLLAKATYNKLSPEESKKVRDQLIDILKTIPAVSIFMIPGGSVLLPILLKFLPKKYIMPSSFLE